MAYRPAQVWTGSAWDDIGDKRVGIQEINTQTANYTLVLADIAKRVQMNNSAARTITIPPNSSVAFPVGTRLDIGNINTGVLTIAGGAGVTVNGRALTLGQWETATVVQRAANTWVVEPQANLTAALGSKVDYPSGGADGNVLTKSGTAAAWSAPEAAGLTLITATTATAVSSLSVNGCFTSTYDSYFILLHGTGTGDLDMRMRASGTDNSSSDYRRGRYFLGVNIGGVALASANNETRTAFTVGNLSANEGSMYVDLSNPFRAVNTTMVAHATGTLLQTIGGSLLTSGSFDGFTLLATSFTLSIKVYGYRN